jgi:hypothetical protein
MTEHHTSGDVSPANASMHYTSPVLNDLGSVADVTRGGSTPNNGEDSTAYAGVPS